MPYRYNQQLTGIGRLQIRTFAVDVGSPASNVVVRITPSGEPNRVLDELITDSSGQAPTIELAAPPPEFSLQYGLAKPYSVYDIQVMMDGYMPQILKGVQILPNTIATQQIRLTPRTAYDTQPRIITIREHTLWGTFPPKIPEDEVKELPPPTGHIVLPEPVVPEFIIVHDGPPNANAPNYWIPFTDYIKNVASSEIFPNWPYHTITANVLAILSFTLNRVFTEWYRGQGHDFTITSSTAYDQAFSYGRNIFEEISTVVDNIFTTFITRPGIRQPLFAQFCDGQRVSCPGWLSQWGSKDLGVQGYAAIDILKSFYGHNIYLRQAEKVEGVPISFPGTPLQVGSTGESVRAIQEQLNTISNNYPAIGKLRVDGIFGEQTRAAVEKFQSIFNIPANGIVSFNTWYRISHIYVAVTGKATL